MSAPQRRRPEGAKPPARIAKAERRRQLLACAKGLLVVHGFPAVTSGQIAEAAGVSETLFQRYFADTRSVFLAVVQEVRLETLVRWQGEVNGLVDPLARLHAITDRLLQATRELPVEFRILQRTLIDTQDEEVITYLRGFFGDCEMFLAQVIGEGQQAGVCRRSLDPRVGAWQLIHNVLGHALTQPLHLPLHQDDYLPRAAECLLQCLIKTDV